MAVDFGIKASRAGNDVLTAATRLLTVTSGVNMYKVAMSAYGTVSIASGASWTTDITHNLGYKPIVRFYVEHPEISQWVLAPALAGIATGGTWDMTCVAVNVDTNTVRLGVYTAPFSPSPRTFKYKYYIMIEPRKDAWYE